MGELQKRGLIRYRRGRVEVVDCRGLEHAKRLFRYFYECVQDARKHGTKSTSAQSPSLSGPRASIEPPQA